MKALTKDELRRKSPVKWHANVPPDGVSLGVADIDFMGPSGITEYIKSNLKEEFSFYQHKQGLPEAVSLASDFLNTKNVPASPSQIQVIEGTMMGIYASMKWISSKSGQVLMVGPTYPPIHEHATRTGNTIEWVDFRNSFEENMKAKISHDTKLIVICNPNNPTGHIFSESELSLIADLADDFQCYIFSDELYEPLPFEKRHISMASIASAENRTIMLYGFSKAYGLAGYRSGFMFLGTEAQEIRKITNELLVAPSPFSSLTLQYALSDSRVKNWIVKFKETIFENTRYAADLFLDAGYDCQYPDGSFFIFPDINTEDTSFEEVLLKKEGVQVVAGSKFGPMAKNHVRINCATSQEYLQEGIQKILNLLSR